MNLSRMIYWLERMTTAETVQLVTEAMAQLCDEDRMRAVRLALSDEELRELAALSFERGRASVFAELRAAFLSEES